MFIIGGLLLTKIFQNRHPDVHANAFVAFFSFAVIIFFTLIGIVSDTHETCIYLVLVIYGQLIIENTTFLSSLLLPPSSLSLSLSFLNYEPVFNCVLQYYDRRNPLAVRFSLLIVILIMVAGFFTSFYYFHRWKFSKCHSVFW